MLVCEEIKSKSDLFSEPILTTNLGLEQRMGPKFDVRRERRTRSAGNN